MADVDINLRDLLRVLRKRKLLLLLTPILMAATTFFFTEVPPPVFNAEALLKITKSSTVAGLMTDIVSYSAYDNMATQITIVTSEPVLSEVAYRLNMVHRGGDAQPFVDELRGSISAEQRTDSDILAIRSTASTNDEAVRLVNTTADAYIDQYRKERDQRLEETVTFIQRRLDESSHELAELENNQSNFRRQNALALALSTDQRTALDLADRASDYQLKMDSITIALDKLTEVSKTQDYEGLLESFFALDDAASRGILDDVTRRSATVVELNAKKSDLLRFQREESPQVGAVASQLVVEHRRLNAQLTNLLRRLTQVKADYQKQLATVQRQEEEIVRQPELYTQLDAMQSIVREKQEGVSQLRRRLEDAEIQRRERVEEISVVERSRNAAEVPQPARYYKTLVGLLIGLLLGGVFAFVLESMDTSIGTIEDVEQYISSAVVGVIPHLDIDDLKSAMDPAHFSPRATSDDLERFSRLVTHFEPRSVGAEAYRTLRTNVSSLMARGDKKVVMVSSSVVQEGKTTCSTNLATAFAQTGKKTLLIDADLRRPTVDKVFGVVRTPGLSDFLLRTHEKKECVRNVDDIILGKIGLKPSQVSPGFEFLTIMPAGRIVNNPAELLGSAEMDALLLEARQEYDVIILDVSPTMPVADAFILAPKVDGIILSYQIGRVARDVLKRTKTRIESLGGHVWGIVMNDIRAEIDYRQGDFQYYRYRYDADATPVFGTFTRLKLSMRRLGLWKKAKTKAAPKARK